MAESWQDIFDAPFLARLEQLHLLAKRVSGRSAAALRRSRRVGDGLEFADHRAYTPGDDVRFVDWPYFARMDRLLLRMFHEHSEADVAILLDCSASMAPGGDTTKFDYARRTLASLAYIAMGSLERVSLLPFGTWLAQGLRTGRGRMQIIQVLEFLATLSPRGHTDLVRCADQFARRNMGPGTVIIVSDLLDCSDSLSEALAKLRFSGHDVSVLHVFTPNDEAPDAVGPMLLRQAETGHRIQVDVSDELLDNYRQQWRDFRRACETACLAREAIYIAAPTAAPFDRLVLNTLRSAGVVGA